MVRASISPATVIRRILFVIRCYAECHGHPIRRAKNCALFPATKEKEGHFAFEVLDKADGCGWNASTHASRACRIRDRGIGYLAWAAGTADSSLVSIVMY